jgi:hypothetical protein
MLLNVLKNRLIREIFLGGREVRIRGTITKLGVVYLDCRRVKRLVRHLRHEHDIFRLTYGLVHRLSLFR